MSANAAWPFLFCILTNGGSMKITGVEIDWMEDYGNNPAITVVVNENLPRYYDVVWRKKGNLYYSILDCGIIKKFYHSPTNQRGFNGSTFKLPMEDGTIEEVVGPWSSRAEAINEMTDINACDISLKIENTGNRYGSLCIIKEVLQNVFDTYMPGIIIENTKHNEYIVPKSQKEIYELITNA